MPRSTLTTTGEWRGRIVVFRNNQLLVAFKANLSPTEVTAALEALVGALPGSSIVAHPASTRWAILGVPQGTNIPELALAIAARPGVRHAEPDFLIEGTLSTNDPAQTTSWWPSHVGLEDAWSVTQGSSSVLIGMVDSGIAARTITDALGVPLMVTDHEDLDPARFILQHIDDAGENDHNYVDDGIAVDVTDGYGHGTHLTGLVAATANNLHGIAGINWVSDVYVARVLDDGKKYFLSSALNAVHDLLIYAIREEYTHLVVNLSFQTPDVSEVSSLTLMMEELEDGIDLDGVSATGVAVTGRELAGRVFACCGGHMLLAGGAAWPCALAADFDHVVAVACTDAFDAVSRPVGDTPEIEFAAPGEDILSTIPSYPADGFLDAAGEIYYSSSGTSVSTAIVTGVVSLMWGVNPSLTPGEIKTLLRDTARVLTERAHPYYLVQAGAAVAAAAAQVALETSQLMFVDVPEGEASEKTVAMYVTGPVPLTFTVTPASISALNPAFTVTVAAMQYDGVQLGDSRITVRYTAGAAGHLAFGEIDIECAQTALKWTVRLSGNTVGRPEAAVVLVLDTSASMAQSSGIEGLTRMDVQQEAAAIAIDTLDVGDTVALVRFADDAALVRAPTLITDPALDSAERAAIRDAVFALAPAGSTSIGDGVSLGHDTVGGVVATNRSLLVVTDGHENTAAFIDDVIDTVTVPVYAIGIGTAEALIPDSLDSLTTASGGALLLTGTIDPTDRYRIAKYLLQALAGVTGDDLILDPSGSARPGQRIDVQFDVTRADIEVDVIVMMPRRASVDVTVVTPGGHEVASDHANPAEGFEFHSGHNVSVFRIRPARGKAPWAGRWTARLQAGTAADAYVRNLKGTERARADAHGVPWCMIVRCRSNLRMLARTHQTGFAPGARATVRAVVTENDRAGNDLTQVHVRIAGPDGTIDERRLLRVSPGVFEASFPLAAAGTYTCRVRAQGWARAGDYFTREQIVTANAWHGEGARAAARARSLRAPSR